MCHTEYMLNVTQNSKNLYDSELTAIAYEGYT